MKTLLILAAAAGVALTAAPAFADPGGKGHGDKQWKHGDREGDRYSSGYSRDDRRYGDRRYANDDRRCPYGLAKKHNGCMAPGQYRKWARGARVPSGYGYTPYSQIPQRYVDQYDLDRDNRYIYRDNNIYQVDPRTQIIQRILGGIIR